MFLYMVIKRQNRKDHSVSAIFLFIFLFFLFIQFTAIETRLVSSHAKLLTVTGKKSGVPMLVGGLQPIFNWQSSISRQIRHVFNMCMCTRGWGGGAGSRNIPLMVSCVPNFRLLHSNILCGVSQFRSLTVPFSGTQCLPPFALTPPCPCPLPPLPLQS